MNRSFTSSAQPTAATSQQTPAPYQPPVSPVREEADPEEIERILAELEEREIKELDRVFSWSMRSSILVIIVKTLAGVFVAQDRGLAVTWALLWRVIPTVRIGATGEAFQDVVWTSTVAVICIAVLWAMLGLAIAANKDSWGLACGTFLAVPMAAVLVALEKFRFPESGVTILSTLRLIGLGGLSGVLFVIFHPPLPHADQISPNNQTNHLKGGDTK